MPDPPLGPFETEVQAREHIKVRQIYEAFQATRRPGLMDERNHRLLCEALTAAGVDLGHYDHRVLLWMAGWEPEACLVVAGLITRAHQARGDG